LIADVVVLGGCGHVGLPLAISLAKNGLTVASLDVDKSKVDLINSGKMPFLENGAEEILKDVLTKKSFISTLNPESISSAGTVIVVVGTPVDQHLDPDPYSIIKILDSYKQFFRPNQLLILRSTVYPGVTKKVEDWVKSAGLNLKVSFCPERIAEGFAMSELIELPQIIGARDIETSQLAGEIFLRLTEKIVVVTPEEAELAKLFTNAWRYIKFSVANQFFMLANDFGIDYEKVREAISFDYPRAKDLPRAGFAAGPCLLKDTMQLSAFSGNTFLLGHSAMLINEGLPTYLVEQIERSYDLSKLTVGILGMAFKANIDDERSSLSYKLKRILKFKAKNVLCSDPFIKDKSFVDEHTLIRDADLVLIGTPHSEYKDLIIDKPLFDIWNMSGLGLLFYEKP